MAAESKGKPTYKLLPDGTFVIGNYNRSRTFSSFFPGIAGRTGIPMWVFYVNRGQCISSFGLRDKNQSILEFFPANNAYLTAGTLGFRTFVKVREGARTVFYEPFQDTGLDAAVTQEMHIRAHELILRDVNTRLGLETTVRLFTLPNEPLAGIVRFVEFRNTGKKKLNLEVVDGLPRITPYGINLDKLKNMSYTAAAWARIGNLEKTGVPYYKLQVELEDSAEVKSSLEGNFYYGASATGKGLSIASAIVDPELVFGQDPSFRTPQAFIESTPFRVPKTQNGNTKYPSAMSFLSLTLAPKAQHSFYALIGHAESEDKLNEYLRSIKEAGYFTAKADENKAMIDEVTAPIMTESARREFDMYAKQTYLDNVLRGGMPVQLPSGKGHTTFYVYSRKHGDPERDYNWFSLSPAYYSQGNGNFRDINQNRRSDVQFFPAITDFNIPLFFNLVQLDGNNPLIVGGTSFRFDTAAEKDVLKLVKDEQGRAALKKFLARPFEPGNLLLFAEQKKLQLAVTRDEFLRQVLGASKAEHGAAHGEGFWVDHWTYNLDLLENYLSVYPDKEREILFNRKEFTYFDSDHFVVPRSEKHVDAGGGKVRQFGSVIHHHEKGNLIHSRSEQQNLVRDQKGKGQVYKSTLAAKMVCLIVNKLATLDSEGIGIEMESNKPGWYDALNGLPGIFGSSTCETFELKRLVQFLKARLKEGVSVSIPAELEAFMAGLEGLLGQESGLSSFEFWDRATTLKEQYRPEVFFGINGAEVKLEAGRLAAFLNAALRKINKGLAKARDQKTGLYHTYFTYEAVGFDKTGTVSRGNLPLVKVTKFAGRPLPLFLEGIVHGMKVEGDREKNRLTHAAVKKSGLYDKALSMYKVNESLAGEPDDIGRCTVFSPGWLENESIWLHMEYKYLLELIRAGLHKEFFAEFEKAGVCYQKPAVYGRSILENSSFIASSAFPEKAKAGRGYIARLSGSTAEFLEIWLLITVGPRPFSLDSRGELLLKFKPAIAKEYFTRNGTFSCMFLGKMRLTYQNPKKKDTFSDSCETKEITITWDNGRTEIVQGAYIAGNLARKVREGKAVTINVLLG